MAKVEISVNGRPYTIGCEDGQEESLRRLAGRFDEEVRRLAGQVGQIGDLRLFLMAGLVMCDAVDEAESRAATGQAARGRDRAEAAAAVTRAAERIEALAAAAERAGAGGRAS